MVRFENGDSVKVKETVMCPDDDSLCMGGWQGRIFEIEDTIGIRWDSITLKQLPLDYIKQSEKEGLGWTEMYLDADEIEPVSPRDTEAETERVAGELENKFQWLDSDDEENRRIYKVIADAEDPNQAWNDYLTKLLVFPFEAMVSENQDHGPLDYGDVVQVNGIDEIDDLYGILAKVSQGREHFIFPLCDLNATDKKSPNYTPFKDYCVWFANR